MDDLRTLKDQRVLVLGGSGSMGQAVARLAVLHGAKVTIAGRDGSRLDAVAE